MSRSASPFDDMPVRAGPPPRFRRNRWASALAFCALAVIAGAGVQYGMFRFGDRDRPPPEHARPARTAAPEKPRIETYGPEFAPVARPADPPADAVQVAAAPVPAPVAALRGAPVQTAAVGAAPTVPPAPVRTAAVQTVAAPPARPAPTRAVVAAAPAPAAKPLAAPPVKVVNRTAPIVRPAAPKRARGPAPAAPAAAKPSFDCATARTLGERQVCGSRRLAALDAQMNAAYARALAEARDPRFLKAEQERWMAVREGAALRDPSMVGPAYERRIAELDGRDW